METRTTVEGIRIPVQIKGQRLAIFKRTPGMFRRLYLAAEPHFDAITFVIEWGYANVNYRLAVYEKGELLFHDELQEKDDWQNHPVFNQYFEKARMAQGRK